MLPSKRMKLSDLAIQWCHENDVSAAPFNIISALDSIGALKDDFEFHKPPEERKEQVKTIEERADELLTTINGVVYDDAKMEVVILALQQEFELTKRICIDAIVNDKNNTSHIVAKRDAEKLIMDAGK